MRKLRHGKLSDFDEAQTSQWYDLEMNKRSHFLFNYPKHQSTHPRTDFQILPLESKWHILIPLLPFEIFQIILATGHEWWSW